MDKIVSEIVIDCLENMGVIIDINQLNDQDINLTDLNIYSLAFVSFIVDLEETLNIIIPEEYLTLDVFKSLKGFIYLVESLVSENE